jgi:hypothetical protein
MHDKQNIWKPPKAVVVHGLQAYISSSITIHEEACTHSLCISLNSFTAPENFNQGSPALLGWKSNQISGRKQQKSLKYE